MKKNLFLSVAALVFSTILLSSSSLYDLSCEGAKNPIGLDRAAPCFSWKIHSTSRGFRQSAFEILVSKDPGFASKESLVWSPGKVKSSQSVLVPYSGKPLESFGKYYWKVRVWGGKEGRSEWSQPQSFSMGLLQGSDWGEAEWISLESDKPEDLQVPALHGLGGAVGKLGGRVIGLYKLPQFRKELDVKKDVARAQAFVCGLGHFEFFLNGKKVGDNFLDPGWTKYDKEALYVSFDVSEDIHKGKNALGVMLGNGFYNVPNVRYFKLAGSFGAPKLKLLLRVEYTDGSVETLVSDQGWKVCESPLTFSSIYGGEDFDARKVKAGWMEPGYDDSTWQDARLTSFSGKLLSQVAEPLKVHSELPCVRLFKNGKGWVYDLGQNFSGVVKVRLHSSKPGVVVFRPAELLGPDSTANQTASGDPFFFSYTSAGKGEESWQPQFTYYGFRYVQVEGAVPAGADNPDALPELLELKGVHTCNSAARVGAFECSKPMFNQIHDLIDWAMRSNMASVLTDCPHREKLGWLEQVHLMQASLQYRYDLRSLYWKLMEDMAASQWDNGCIPCITPEYVRFEGGFEDTPEWGSAFILSPWYIYRWYGDKRMLRAFYPQMRRYVEYLSSRADGGIISYGLGDWFDLGPGPLGPSQLTSNGVTATAIYFYDVSVMAKIASELGEEADAAEYSALAERVRKAFLDKFLDPKTGKIERGSQTASGMSLFVGLVPEEDRPRVLGNLVEDIRSRDNALSAGDIGYRYVLQSLEEGGRSDVIFDMNSKYDVPGYGWQLAHGATALTESWQAYGFVSNNHFMLGHLMEWLYSGLGGIKQEEGSVAWSEILIDPQVVGDVKSARTTYESPYGRISCDWEDSEEEFRLEATIPANTTARVSLPCSDPRMVFEYGRPLLASPDIQILEEGVPGSVKDGSKEDGKENVDAGDGGLRQGGRIGKGAGTLSLRVGSGTYSFVVRK